MAVPLLPHAPEIQKEHVCSQSANNKVVDLWGINIYGLLVIDNVKTYGPHVSNGVRGYFRFMHSEVVVNFYNLGINIHQPRKA